ncbi:hypothetical protein GQX74_008362 [Glossina fuscipes]|nr:hypothetical protein GQX74_008362 [Glossina fuscipes]
MHSLCAEKCEENNQSFVKEENIWQKCKLLKGKTEGSRNEKAQLHLRQRHDLHLQERVKRAERATNRLSEYQKESLPHLKVSVSLAYYKRNMCVYNLGFHNFHDDNVNMYVWDESTASRVAQEAAACIFLHTQAINSQKHVIAYSDACLFRPKS